MTLFKKHLLLKIVGELGMMIVMMIVDVVLG